jgi:rhodanese-related sulfurtransferase
MKKMHAVFFALALCFAFPLLARAEVPSIDATEIGALLAKEPGSVLILDVRTTGEYQGGHMQKAVLIPMRDVPTRLAEIPRQKKIVVVCASGARSGAVADYLIGQGYPWVRNYAGGMWDWARRGLPIAK